MPYVGHQWHHLRYERMHFVDMWWLFMPLHRGPLPSVVALPYLWAVLHWMGKLCTASQRHTVAASFYDLPLPSVISANPLSPAHWRQTGSGWSVEHCCGCCWAQVHPSSRWSCLERCGIRPGVPSPLCFPPPLSHPIPPRWTMDPTSCFREDALLQFPITAAKLRDFVYVPENDRPIYIAIL